MFNSLFHDMSGSYHQTIRGDCEPGTNRNELLSGDDKQRHHALLDVMSKLRKWGKFGGDYIYQWGIHIWTRSASPF